MNIYAISDFHLSFGTNKPMNIFGDKWIDYEKKIEQNWKSKVKEDDVVILAGDFSWATYLDEAVQDFEFLNKLPGTKIMLKGNHDYWWETLAKLNKFTKENNFSNIYFLHNNFYKFENYYICGTRYWQDEEGKDNEKIYKRELERLKISLDMAKNDDENGEIILVTHYPPTERIMDAIKGYNVKKWIYGHIHSNYEDALVNINGIDTYLTSCDYLEFDLVKIC